MNSCEMKFTIFMLKFARNRILYFANIILLYIFASETI